MAAAIPLELPPRRRQPRAVSGVPRPSSIAVKRLSKEQLRIGRRLNPPADDEYLGLPETRGECLTMERPCPYVSCRHHLYLDVSPQTGSIKRNRPDLESWEMPETCALDVADRGGATLEEVGVVMNLTRERIRQLEVRGLERLRTTCRRLGLSADALGLEEAIAARHTAWDTADEESEHYSISGRDFGDLLDRAEERLRGEHGAAPSATPSPTPAPRPRPVVVLPPSLASMAGRLGGEVRSVEVITPTQQSAIAPPTHLPAAPAGEEEQIPIPVPLEPCAAPGGDKRKIEPRREHMSLTEKMSRIEDLERGIREAQEEIARLTEELRSDPDTLALLRVLGIEQYQEPEGEPEPETEPEPPAKPGPGPEPDPSSKMGRILAALRTDGPQTAGQLVGLGIALRNSVSGLLSVLRERGLVVNDGGRWSAVPRDEIR
jgi:hypothetical protein